MNWVIFIEARADSQRLAAKHMLDIGGRMMIERVMHTASLSDADMVIMSTDCPEMLRVAQHNDIAQLNRPKDLCTEGGRTWVEWTAAMNEFYYSSLADKFNDDEFVITRLMGNSIIFDSTLVNRSYEMLIKNSDASAVRSVTTNGECHPNYFVRLAKDGSYKWNPKPVKPAVRSAYHTLDSGPWTYHLPVREGKNYAVKSNFMDVVHIHDKVDLEVARALWSYRMASSAKEKVMSDG